MNAKVNLAISFALLSFFLVLAMVGLWFWNENQAEANPAITENRVAVNDLYQRVAELEKIEPTTGPQGPQGPRGTQGVAGADGEDADTEEIVARIITDTEFLEDVSNQVALALTPAQPSTETTESSNGILGGIPSSLEEYRDQVEEARGLETEVKVENGVKVTTTTDTNVTTSSLPAAAQVADVNGWYVEYFEGATLQMLGQGSIPWAAFPTLDPPLWVEFPDVDNPEADFPAEWGMYYAQDQTQFCGAANDQCDLVVAGEHYTLVTGSWSLDGLGSCVTTEDQPLGCALLIVNVGYASAEFTGTLDNTFIVTGNYFHGDHLPEAITAVMAHATWNMTDGVSELNPTELANAGGNCSFIEGCLGVNNQFFVTSGIEVLIHGEVDYERPTP